jgi:hypothetical protein
VLALCVQAEIITTTAHVRFNDDGTRSFGRKRRAAGSEFSAIVRLTQKDFALIEDTIDTLIPPPNIATTFNGRPINQRTPLKTFTAFLPTVIADADGILRTIDRPRDPTTVDIYEPLPGETAMVYELGIPVVATADRFHVDVRRKVPLNSDRDNVTPSFLRRLRTEVLNATFERLDEESARSVWVNQALEDKRVSPAAVTQVVRQRFGDNAVTADPSDRDANARAMASGRPVIYGGSFSAEQWVNIRAAGAAPPTTVEFATPRILSGGPNAPVVDTLAATEYTVGMRYVSSLARMLAENLLGVTIETAIVRSPEHFRACYGDRRMLFNLRSLGRDWFETALTAGVPDADVIGLILHELAHEIESNHLSEAFYHGLSTLGGRLCVLTIRHRDSFSVQALCGSEAA